MKAVAIRSTFPVVVVDAVLHWGDLNGADTCRHSNSLEGPLLSCSTSAEAHEAWHQIAQLGGQEEWTLTKAGGFTLVDFHAISIRRKKQLLTRARGVGLLHPQDQPAWKLSYDYEDEDGEGSRRYSLHPSHAAAHYEIDAPENRSRIHKIHLPAPTPALCRYWYGRTKDKQRAIDYTDVIDAALCACFDGLPEFQMYDGIFWDELLDPEAYSAPRAGLFQRTVALASRTKDGVEEADHLGT